MSAKIALEILVSTPALQPVGQTPFVFVFVFVFVCMCFSSVLKWLE
jgi:hypothetical protein